MTPLDGLPVLDAAAIRAAEQRAIDQGSDVDTLMARAGEGVAAWVGRLAGHREVLVLCGPGNNGGDGYVAAARLRAIGHQVRVAASAPPASPAAIRARQGWEGAVDDVMTAAPAPVLVDALFGTGLSRPLESALSGRLAALAEAAWLTIAVDLPSGLSTDDGAALDVVPTADLTLALGALKPAHLLQPAARHCGALRVINIGLGELASDCHVIDRPNLPDPGPDDHKFTRGLVAVVEGVMPGAAALAAQAALHAGAGYVLLLGAAPGETPHAIVRRPWRADLAEVIGNRTAAALVVGPGLGRDDAARARLDAAMASPYRLVIDGDALHLLDAVAFRRIQDRVAPVVLTPHAGEFAALFGRPSGSKIDAARTAARASGATVVFKGADTVVAHPDGRAALALPGTPWLSTAGTGDVLAGAIGAMLAAGHADAAEAGVWLHAAAARTLTGPFIADDLARALVVAR